MKWLKANVVGPQDEEKITWKYLQVILTGFEWTEYRHPKLKTFEYYVNTQQSAVDSEWYDMIK